MIVRIFYRLLAYWRHISAVRIAGGVWKLFDRASDQVLVQVSEHLATGQIIGQEAKRIHTVDGQNPFRTTLKPWLNPLFVGIYR